MWKNILMKMDGRQAGRQATKSKYIFLKLKKKWGKLL
jgi:hypothetical protein